MSDLEWKIIYVGSAESEAYDQVLDTVVVGPLCGGRHMFVFEVGFFRFSIYEAMSILISGILTTKMNNCDIFT